MAKAYLKKYHKKFLNGLINFIIVLFCLLMIFVVVINVTIFAKRVIRDEEVPGFMGIMPLIVESGSMEPVIKVGDLIFIRKEDVKKLSSGQDGSIIAYSDHGNIVTHRIIDTQSGENGELLYATQGDANNTADANPVKADAVLGTYIFRIPKLGTVVTFMQTPAGIALFIICPLAVYIIFILHNKNRRLHREADRVKQLELELSSLQMSKEE